MALTDFIIVYLTCGAPFAAYYFLQNRHAPRTNQLWLKTFLIFVFWMPYAFRFIKRHKVFGQALNFIFTKTFPLKNTNEDKITRAQKRIEKFLLENQTAITLFEFRETAARYVGLFLAGQSQAAEISPQEKEIFLAAEIKNVEIAATCLRRRNRERLVHHQIEARKDFLHSIKEMYDSLSDRTGFEHSALEIAESLKDIAAQTALEKMFASNLQTDKRLNVEHLEKDLWNTKRHKPLTAKPISTRLQTISAAANSRGKD